MLEHVQPSVHVDNPDAIILNAFDFMTIESATKRESFVSWSPLLLLAVSRILWCDGKRNYRRKPRERMRISIKLRTTIGWILNY